MITLITSIFGIALYLAIALIVANCCCAMNVPDSEAAKTGLRWPLYLVRWLKKQK